MTSDQDIEKLEELLFKKCNADIDEIELFQDDHITADQIDEIILGHVALIHQKMGREVLEAANIKAVGYRLATRAVRVDENKKFVQLRSGRIPPWLAKENPKWELWKPYKEMLLSKPISKEVVDDNEALIDSALDLSGNPKLEGDWLRKGLIMGNVQSGKTMNFIGLINKAMDVKYHCVIILGGHMNELRKQCQERVDEGVIGISTSNINLGKGSVIENELDFIGVGLAADGIANRPHALTTVNSDFNMASAKAHSLNFDSPTPVVFVIKKNVSIMKRLISWLESRPLKPGSGRDRPMLLIDDEADYASINTKATKNEFAATNTAIKDLLNLFNRRTYIGYTATPFANVFIPYSDTVSGDFDDDLFPSDFMLKMPTPGNYVGQDYYFPAENDDELESERPVRIIRGVDDYVGWLPLKHKKDFQIESLHPQLEEAILVFLCVVAIRTLRGQEKEHNTMLVNVSRFNDVQASVTEEIKNFLDRVSKSVVAYGALPIDEALVYPDIKNLAAVYANEFVECEFDFEEVLSVILRTAKRVEVEMVNGLSQKKTGLPYSDYEEGLWVIAVGGLKLSRGLTLEGLSVSFFLRNAMAYDTLTQMCRWFGYRPGYKDLCRLYITQRSDDHYNTVAQSIRELDNDLRLMELSNSSPRDFGLKVRSSEEALLVTAKNKMGTATEMKMHYLLWGKPYSRLRAHLDNRNQKNFQELTRIVDEMSDSANYQGPYEGDRPFILRGVSYRSVIDLVSSISIPNSGPANDPAPVVKALRALEKRELELPTVMIFSRSSEIGGKSGNASKLIDSDGKELTPDFEYQLGKFKGKPIFRTLNARSGYVFSRNVLVGDSDDLRHLFSEKEKEELIDGVSVEIKNDFYRQKISAPVVVIYLVQGMIPADNTPGKYKLVHEKEPTVMYAIHFPLKKSMLAGSGLGNETIEELDTEVTYLVNEVLRGVTEDEFGDEDDDISNG